MQIYLILTIIYTSLGMIDLLERLGGHATYENSTKKDIFKVYDLGMLIFPLSIPIIIVYCLLACIGCLVSDSEIFQNSFLNKNLFKRRNRDERK